MTLDTIPGWSAEWGNADQSIDWKGAVVQAQKDSSAAMQLIQLLRSFGISTRFEATTQAALITVNVGSGPGVVAKEQRVPDAVKIEGANNCPNGICISGGTVNGNPTVNNNNFGSPKPPPHIEWSLQEK